MKKQNKKSEKYEIERLCAYCEKATKLAGEDYVLCKKRGVVAQGYVCRSFIYDPIKRKPKRLPQIPADLFEN